MKGKKLILEEISISIQKFVKRSHDPKIKKQLEGTIGKL